jgi:enamine deaminase RidA (YjgF/YER057c/UK114 family)
MDRETFTQSEWLEAHDELHLSPALRVGNDLYLSGHTGEPGHDPETQIREAFEDATRSLVLAGATWSDVIAVTSYHVGLREHLDAIVRVHNEFVTTPPYPTWTGVGVTELANGSIIEVVLVARMSGS